MKKTSKNKSIKQREKLATICMVVGVGLILISTFINLVYIKPTNFKQQFKERQLEDCLSSTTTPESCRSKFGR